MRSAKHATFTIERQLDFPPAKVYSAFADQKAKDHWFTGPDDWKLETRVFDFRPGGREKLKGKWPEGKVSDFDCIYQDIIPNERIVYTYEMHINGNKISVSLATIEFVPKGKGTTLKVTEQGVFLDGYDDAGSREKGTGWLLDRMAESLKAAA
jgi:uncharacterized protein YndB with AHSA1/START domain